MADKTATAASRADFKIKPRTDKKTWITDTILRDSHQSLLATRMRTADMMEVASMLDRVGYWSLEAWGGATFDACLRFLKEDPWERLKLLRKAIPNTRLQMLLRGQNLVGYRHYSDDVVKKFVERAARNGIDVFRIFDALNDMRNIEVAVRAAKEAKAIVEATICYTTSPVHTHEGFVELALKLVKMGADTICIKDMAGLLTPVAAFDLVTKMRARVNIPIHIHSHDSSGLASMSYLKAIEAGADIVDTAISSLASGTSQPPTESMVAALNSSPYSTGLDLGLLAEIADRFRDVRRKYKKFESEYTAINPKTLVVQIPGGMISNLANQLREQNALDKMDAVFEEIPKVRKDMGYPPLVTPTSQVVGTQATLNVLMGERYKVITSETRNYFKGLYGNPPGPIDETARKLAISDEKPITCRPADLLEPELDKVIRDIDGKAKSIEDVLSYALFPMVALEFFEQRDNGKLEPEPLEEEFQPAADAGHTAPHLAPSEFNVTVHGENYKIKVAGAGHRVEGKRPFFISIDGKLEEVMIESLTEVIPTTAGEIERSSITQSIRPKARKEGDVTTPIPGKVTSIKVSVGSKVSEGDTVLTVEAMKMENEVHTPISGIVKKVLVKIGDSVNPDETLMEVEKE
ncbi:MAG: sodium-extruding oxaloacetate decarboxylase subunit alpha [Deltaproteobacteria bacterium]|nr:sodium-extruding oxaloacetate decarboxylase subunit alpha [Deltaproteobacteria bacterium]MBZ0220596.1 sodium-extruding oxaloacetate decarboxylase subunit alpha [Deltaproteobacteria bacterium]